MLRDRARDIVWRRRFEPPLVTHTSGRGAWTEVAGTPHVLDMICWQPGVWDLEHMMTVFVTKESWDTDVDGFIYTDPLWIEEIAQALIKMNFSPEAADSVDYAELFHQNGQMVMLTVGEKFVEECNPVIRWINDYEQPKTT